MVVVIVMLDNLGPLHGIVKPKYNKHELDIAPELLWIYATRIRY